MMREGEGEERDDSNKKSTVFNEARCGFITLPDGCMLISVTPAVRSIVLDRVYVAALSSAGPRAARSGL